MTDDVQAIKNLVHSYAEFLDLGDFDSMAALFEHATVGMPGAEDAFTGADAIRTLPLQPILAGRWHDHLEKVDGRWRFAKRVIYNDLVGDISCHLKGAE